MTPPELSAAEAIRQMRAGEITCEALVTACLERINEVDGDVQAWAHLDRDYALEQARQRDAARQSGRPCGPLHGVPVGVKDIFDTRGAAHGKWHRPRFGPATDGGLQGRQPAWRGRRRHHGQDGDDGTRRLRPGKDAQPPQHGAHAGGSSSGSAAAVAAGMVPLAVGTQTNGSVIRPAAYCGIVGFKPSHGMISRHGILALSRWLDTVGTMARNVEDAALIADVLAAYDDRDPDMTIGGRARLAETAAEDPPLTPMLAFVKSPVWDQTEEATREAFAELAEFLGEGCDDVTLPEPFERAVEWHRAIMYADLAKSFAAYFERGKDRLSRRLREMIEEGRKVLAVDYNRAVDWREVLNSGLDQVFERYDAVITPATTGEAPAGLDSTGDPVFCTLWTYCGTPTVTLPLMAGPGGLPLGVQLVGRRGDDARLLRTARWLVSRFAADGGSGGIGSNSGGAAS